MANNDFDSSIVVPPALSLDETNYTNRLAAGHLHGVAITFDKEIISWGDDVNGEVANSPTTLDFIQVSAGNGFSVGLKEDKSLESWGAIPAAPIGNNFVKTSAQGDHAVALTDSGHLEAIGVFNFDLPTHGGFIDVACGVGFIVGIMWDNTILGFGNISGIPTGSNFIKIDAGENHATALTSDYTVVSFGDDSYGQVSNAPTTNDFDDIACGRSYSIALKTDGSTVIGWGRDNHSQLLAVPDYPKASYIEISAGWGWGILLGPEGEIKPKGASFVWGKDDFGQVTDAPPYIGYDQEVYVPTIEMTNLSYSPQRIESINPTNLDFSFTIKEVQDNTVPVTYDIKMNGTTIFSTGYYSDTPINISKTVSYDDLVFGGNLFEIYVESSENIKNTRLSSFSVSKIDNTPTEITFSEDLIARETLIKVLHTNELITMIDQDKNRRNVIRPGCNSGCDSLCQGCTGGCTSSCGGSCSSGCTTSCTGGCSSSCSGSCDGCDFRWF